MRFDAVLFDLDGTLSESAPGIVHAAEYAIAKLGYPPLPKATLLKFIGPPLWQYFMEHCGMSHATALTAVEYYRELHKTVGWKETSMYPGIYELLKALKHNGVYVALASSKPRPACEMTLEYFGIRRFFDKISAPDIANPPSSKKETILAALPEKYTRACMVGDRKFDMAGAIEAGVYPIGVSYGYGSGEELRAAGAQELCPDVAALRYALLENAPFARGLFITLEGSDGCGKSTQAPLLIEALRSMGIRVTRTREPGGCPIAEGIRGLILDKAHGEMTPECEALLFAAARAQHVHDTIRPALERGEFVVCDRFVDSSIAYQGSGRGLGDWVEQINLRPVGDCVPDITLIFDLNPETAIRRRLSTTEADRIELAPEDFRLRLYNAFKEMGNSGDKRFNIIDASGSIEQVADTVRQTIVRLINLR